MLKKQTKKGNQTNPLGLWIVLNFLSFHEFSFVKRTREIFSPDLGRKTEILFFQNPENYRAMINGNPMISYCKYLFSSKIVYSHRYYLSFEKVSSKLLK